jgi:hypothetical protein
MPSWSYETVSGDSFQWWENSVAAEVEARPASQA